MRRQFTDALHLKRAVSGIFPIEQAIFGIALDDKMAWRIPLFD